MFIDPIADLILRVKNANSARLPDAVIQTSNLTTSILEVLQNEGYILSYEVKNLTKIKKQTVIKLKYKNLIPTINGFKQISKPGLRVYAQATKIPKVLNGLGVAIISTSNGVVSDKVARAKNLGGEVIAYIW